MTPTLRLHVQHFFLFFLEGKQGKVVGEWLSVVPVQVSREGLPLLFIQLLLVLRYYNIR